MTLKLLSLTWTLGHEDAPHVLLGRVVARQPHPGLLHQPHDAPEVTLSPAVSPASLPTLALGRPLDLRGAEEDQVSDSDDGDAEYDVPGENDVLGPGEHEDGRRVLAGLVVELLRDLVTLPDLEARHLPQPRDDLSPEPRVPGIDPSVCPAPHNPPEQKKLDVVFSPSNDE